MQEMVPYEQQIKSIIAVAVVDKFAKSEGGLVFLTKTRDRMGPSEA